jgi:hypothetical protein
MKNRKIHAIIVAQATSNKQSRERSPQKSPQQICSHLTQLKKALRRKNLSKCLEILENQGIEGELSLFVLSVINVGDFDKCKFAEAADLISGGEA